jgi:hypothetical protein
MLNLYDTWRYKIKTADIIEFRGNSFVSNTIRKVTDRDVNHTAMVIKPRVGGLLPPDRLIILEATSGGVQPAYLSKRIEETIKDKNTAVFWIPVKKEFGNVREAIAMAAIDEYMIQKPKYDYLSVFSLLLTKVSVDASKYFCSEYVQKKHVQFGILPKNTLKKALRPGDFKKFPSYMPRVMLATNDYLERSFLAAR